VSKEVPPEGASPAAAPPARPAGGSGGMFARNRAAAGPPAAPSAGIPLSLAERTAAKRLQESKQTVPHFYLQTSVNASAIVARRRAAEPAKLAWDAFFVVAVARAIARFDRFRCRLDGEHLAPAGTDAIGVAVDQEGDLYVVPIASPAAKTVEQVSDEIRQIVERLRSGDCDARRIRPALMTVTNLGVCNVECFVPIINPPEAAILGVGRVMPTPVAQDDGRIGIEHRCTVTLSVDHRVASGRYAGEFLGAIVREMEAM
jgi:pyruvate dehydrogenase E2 component (dihydrolipoamide acetyltransferase)